MADSGDEDTSVTIGTPVEIPEDDAPRKKAVPIHEQIVTDSAGRRRFHGAFTGGFSAGHFNTVGTKEGWAPSSFISSRSKKNENASLQRPEDFMDDEDFEEYGIAPKRLVTKQEFLSTTQRELETRRKRDAVIERSAQHGIPGVAPLHDLVVPAKMSIGVDLLKQMGWKEGQGVGPRVRRAKKKVYGCALPPSGSEHVHSAEQGEEDIYAVGMLFAPKDVEVVTFTPKDDLHGIGYRGIDPTTALSAHEDWPGLDPIKGRSGKMGIRGKAFGVGAFEEEDEDIYGMESLSKYDIELSTEKSSNLHGWTGPPQAGGVGGLLAIFTKPCQPPPCRKHYPPPVIPKDFKPFHKPKEPTQEEVVSKPSVTPEVPLTATDRSKMLGEVPLPTPKKSVFDYVSEEDKARLQSVKAQKAQGSSRSTCTPLPSIKGTLSPASGTSVTGESSKTLAASVSSNENSWSSLFATGSSSFKPFAKDPAKQGRYEAYLRLKKGEKPTLELQGSGLTEWEREREQEEFYRAAMLYRPLSSSMAARFTTAKQPDDHNTVYEHVPEQQASDASDQSKAAAMKMYGRLTRDQFEWHPDRRLCKRFNIPDPYPGSSAAGVPKVRKEKFTLNREPNSNKAPLPIEYQVAGEAKADITEPHSENSGKTPVSTSNDEKESGESVPTSGRGERSSANEAVPVASASARASRENESATDENLPGDAGEEPKRPPMDLFKAIFADSSSEDESEEGDEEEVDTKAVSVAPDSSTGNGVLETKREADTTLPEAIDHVKNSSLTAKETQVAGKSDENGAERLEKRTKSPSPETYGPALPSARPTELFSNVHRHASLPSRDSIRKEERPQDRWKERSLDSSDSEDDRRSKHKRKRKNKDKDRDRDKGKERTRHKKRERDKDKRKEKKTERTQLRDRTSVAEEREDARREDKRRQEGAEETHETAARPKQSNEKQRIQEKLPDDKEILSRLKNMQAMKGRRMRAADFM